MSFDLDLYFDRIGWRPKNETPLEILRLVHFHHIHAIPFENLDVYNKTGHFGGSGIGIP